MNGSVYKRCPCTKDKGGKQNKKTCKKDHGSWYFTHDLPAVDGRRPRIRRGGFPAKDAAETALAESLARCAQRGIAAERDTSGRRQLLGDYLKEWLGARPDIKPSTQASYAYHVYRYLIPFLGNIRLEDLAVSHIAAMCAELRQPQVRPARSRTARKAPPPKPQQACLDGSQPRGRGQLRAAIREFLNARPGEDFSASQVARAVGAWKPPVRKALKRLVDLGEAQLVSKDPARYAAVGDKLRPEPVSARPSPRTDARDPVRLSPASIQRIHATLRAALNDAVRQRLLDYNPAQLVKLESVPRPPTRYWTSQEAGQFLDAVVEDRLYALYHLAVYRGLRRGEILALRWEDVDLDKALLTVARNVVTVRGKPVPGTPKSESSKRTIALDPDTVLVLRSHRQRQQRERGELGDAYRGEDRVFAREDGTLLYPQYLSRHLDVLARKAQVRRLRFHELRHTAATLMFEAGADIKYVSHVLGHSDISITAKIYAEVTIRLDLQRSADISGTIPRRRLLPPGDEDGVPARVA